MSRDWRHHHTTDDIHTTDVITQYIKQYATAWLEYKRIWMVVDTTKCERNYSQQAF